MNQIIADFIEEHGLQQTGNDDLFDNPRIFDIKGDIRVKPYVTPMALTDPVTRTMPQVFNGPALRMVDNALEGRNEGVVFIEDAPIALNAGAVATVAFDTQGHAYIYCTVDLPAYATNPTGLTVELQVSNDAFDTQVYAVLAADGVAIVQVLQFGDNQQYSWFMPTQSNLGVPAAGRSTISAPIPTVDDLVARLLFTPVGAAITAEELTLNVYGITPR